MVKLLHQLQQEDEEEEGETCVQVEARVHELKQHVDTSQQQQQLLVHFLFCFAVFNLIN